MIPKTIRLYFSLNKRVMSTLVGFAFENQKDISEIISKITEGVEVFKTESEAYDKHVNDCASSLKELFAPSED